MRAWFSARGFVEISLNSNLLLIEASRRSYSCGVGTVKRKSWVWLLREACSRG